MTTILLRNADFIYTCDDENCAFRNGYIRVKGRQVVDVGSEPCPDEEADASFDLSGCLVIPGLINTHHHFFQSIARGIPATQRAFAIDWLAGLYPLWAELDPDAIYWASMAASDVRTVPPALRSGVVRKNTHNRFSCSIHLGGTRVSGGCSRDWSHLALEIFFETGSGREMARTPC